MQRGTTPTHFFNLPFDTSLISCVRVIYAQHDQVVFVKSTADCIMEGDQIRVTLTQEDTLLLDCSALVQVQLRVLTTAGEALATDVILVGVGKCLDNEVLT